MPSRFWKASGNALLPSCNTFTTAGAAFSPSSLSPKFWYKADPAKLYTDAGTTLVSADGDAIQQANDKSGNAINLSQGTLADRPLYKTGAGQPYILFDGTNDAFDDDGTGRTYGDGSGQMWMAVCAYTANTSSGQWLAHIRSGAGNTQLRLTADTGAVKAYTDSGGGAGPLSAGSETVNVQFVLIVQLTTTQLAAYFNNGAAVTGAIGSALDTTTATFHLGYQVFANNNYWNGGLKECVGGAGVLSGTDRTNLYNYLSAL